MEINVSIIIVAYKSQKMIEKCVESIIKFTLQCTYEIIIVDNGAKENHNFIIPDYLACQHIVLIPTPSNIGFARANNIGIRRSKGKSILLINPDTEVISDSISFCHNSLQKSSYAACGTQLIFPDGTYQMSGWHFTFKNIGFFIKIPYFKYLYDKIRKEPANHEYTNEKENIVDWINGAFLMVKWEAINKVGCLDEEFFLYSEEPEWCYRLNSYGKLIIFPEHRVIHKVGGITDTEYSSEGKGYFYIFDQRGLQMIVSEFLKVKKQYGKLVLIFQYLIFLLSIPLVSLINLLEQIAPNKKKMYSKKEILGYSSNIIRSARYVIMMVSGRKYFYKILK